MQTGGWATRITMALCPAGILLAGCAGGSSASNCTGGDCPDDQTCLDGTCTPLDQTGPPKGTACSANVIACYDEFATADTNLECFLPTSRWSKTELTWKLAQPLDTEDAPTVELQTEVIKQAMLAWSAVTTLEITQAATTTPADINISFVQNEHGDPYALDGAGAVLGHAFFPGSTSPGEIHLCRSEPWALSPGEGKIDLFTVALHEIGHALGLDHASDENAVMAPGYREGGHLALTLTDIDAIQRLYGSPGGEVPPEPARDPSEFCDPSDLTAAGDPDSDGDGIPDTIEVFAIGSDPFQFDSDNDGADDFNEVFVAGTPAATAVPTAAEDADGDQLTDQREAELGTDPQRDDTDGDGLRDGREVLVLGTNPLARDTDRDGFVDNADPFPTNPAFPKDCNDNGQADTADIAAGIAEDCNTNNIPDDCELATNDANENGVLDKCEGSECDDGDPCTIDLLLQGECVNLLLPCDDGMFCNGVETCQDGFCNPGPPACPFDQFCNEQLDQCTDTPQADCNANQIDDAQDIADQTSQDCNQNGRPDECEPDCNGNGVADACDITTGSSADNDGNQVPDECNVIFVNDTATGTNAGTSWQNAFTGLQRALSAAGNRIADGAPGVEIWVAEGFYVPGPVGGPRASTYTMRSNVKLIGGFGGFETSLEQRNLELRKSVLSGDLDRNDPTTGNNLDNAFHVVTFVNTDDSAVLDGFVVSDGNANGAVDSGGGGIIVRDGGASIFNCSLIANQANVGGGLFSRNASPLVVNTEFRANEADTNGGAIAVNAGQPIFINCTASENTTDFGQAGGLSASQGQIKIANSVFWRNLAPGSPVETAQIFFDSGTQIPSVIHSCIEGLVTGGAFDSGTNEHNIGLDPKFLTPGFNLRLAPGSPCIDAGDNDEVPLGILRDRDSLPRFHNAPEPDTGAPTGAAAIVDMGAYEFPD